MRQLSALVWAAALAAPVVAAPPLRPAGRPGVAATPAAAPDPNAVSRDILHVQVILDHLGFSPGMLDGRPGQSLTAALKGFQESRGLPITGQPDPATLRALYPSRNWRPTVTVALTPAMVAGPFYPGIPKNEDRQAKLPALGYRNVGEKLGEMFHTTPQAIAALNGGSPTLGAGAKVVLPNAVPGSRNYDGGLREDWRATLAMLNVDANQPQAARIEVTKSGKVLRVFDGANKLVAQFQVTTGSEHDPLPIGHWKITGIDQNPKFHFNPALFWDAKPGETRATLPPGPNGPVGVVWMNLDKPHYGIHGTPEPQNIGRTESHGCVRLANWNAARLSLMVKPGTPVEFKE